MKAHGKTRNRVKRDKWESQRTLSRAEVVFEWDMGCMQMSGMWTFVYNTVWRLQCFSTVVSEWRRLFIAHTLSLDTPTNPVVAASGN